MLKQAQKGFTLIELMIVIAIIGILAAVAVPQYGQYTKKARFAEVVSSTSAIKTAISVCVQENNTLTDCDTYAEIGTAAPAATPNLASVAITETSALLTATGTAKVDGKIYALLPTLSATGSSVTWAFDTSSNCAAAGLCK